jgi:hypothetical protein
MVRSRGFRLSLALVLGVAGCDRRTPVDLAAAGVLEGEWTLTLSEDLGRGVPVQGVVALLINRSGTRIDDFSGVPLNVGVHDLRLGALAPGLAPKGMPDVAASVVADSAILVIGPGARVPLRLRGAYWRDSIVGRWTAYQRSGPSAAGTFTMRRR